MSKVAGNVLVVDDDDLVRTVMALELEDQGCSVLTAEDGAQALEALKGHHIAVAVIDLNMPAIGGFALIAVLRSDWPALPIIATSGAAPDEPLPEGVIFLMKPHQPGQLWAAVQVATLTAQYKLT